MSIKSFSILSSRPSWPTTCTSRPMTAWTNVQNKIPLVTKHIEQKPNPEQVLEAYHAWPVTAPWAVTTAKSMWIYREDLLTPPKNVNV